MLVHTLYSIWPHHCYCQRVHHHVTAIDEQWRSMGRQKGPELHHWGEFLHNYYMCESVHDSDHNGVVRTFVALSCELWGLIIYLHYMEQFFPYQECKELDKFFATDIVCASILSLCVVYRDCYWYTSVVSVCKHMLFIQLCRELG